MNENFNLPPLGEPREQLLAKLRPYLLDPRIDYPEPYYMYEYNGVPFSVIGGIQALSGQKKNGKTFVLTQLLAAALDAGESDRTAAFLHGLRVPQRTLEWLGHKPRVLYVDTEMDMLNTSKVLRRVNWLCDRGMKEASDRFNVLRLLDVDDVKDENGKVTRHLYEERFQLIEDAVEVFEPDVLFIDGIRDIIGDFNDNAEASSLIAKLMRLATKKQMCIWNALHMNPRPGNDDESKMRGHLGTELGNKVTDTLVSIKKRDGNCITFTVKQQDARSKDIDDWKFEITDDAGELGIPRIIDNYATPISPSKENEPLDIESLKSWIKEAAYNIDFPISRNAFKTKVIGQIGGIGNNGKKEKYLKAAFENRFIEESTLKKNGAYMVTPTEELLNEMPF